VKEIKFSVQESQDIRRRFLGIVWGLSLIFFDIGDDTTLNRGLPWFFSMISFALAVYLIFQPKKNWVWLSLGIVVPLQVLAQLPIVKNHSVFFAAFAVAVAVSYLTNRFSRKSQTEDWVTRSESFLRLVFFVGYGAAAISKLNSGFFDYTISCANSMALEELGWLPFASVFKDFTWLPFAIAGTELFVFFGLMFKISRPWALMVGALFHFAISLNVSSAAIAFNPALYAMFCLFLPNEASNWLTVKWREFSYRLGKSSRQTLAGFLVLALAIAFIFFKFVPMGPYMLWPSFLLRLVFSVAIVTTLVLGAFRFRDNRLAGATVSMPSILAGLTIAIIALNAASPYLGGKTGATFTMFSNLRVEGGKSNHFFLPRLPIETMQDDLVTILDSSNKSLKSFKESQTQITYFTLQQILAHSPSDSVTYLRKGVTETIDKVSESDLLADYDPFLGAVLHYRVVPEKGTCAW
jgi:hypothetical protein